MMQIFLGGVILVACTVFHILLLMGTIPLARWAEAEFPKNRKTSLMVVALGFVVFAHVVQVGLWAAVLIFNANLNTWEEAIYFSLSTYTTVGYGDVVLDSGMRIVGAMEAVTGMMSFGISTAYLVALQREIFEIEDNSG